MKACTQLIFKVVLSVCLGIFHFSCTETTQERAPEKGDFKNVVFIISDDHSPEVVGAYGNKIIRTPNLDRLASEGTRFTRAYANSPICSASRQSMMTAKYPHATGVNLLFTPFPDDGNVTIAEHLKNQGYKTALVGKTHFNNWVFNSLYKEGQQPDHGWDYLIDKKEHRAYLEANPAREVPPDVPTRQSVAVHEGAAWTKNADMLPEALYDQDSEGTFLANWAADFIRENKENKFCLWVAFHEPHAPFSFPIEYAGRYQPEDMPLPTGSAEDERWVPMQFKNLSEAQRRGIIASYYTSVAYMDKNVGIVLDALRDNGLEENTLVIFNGDQGYLLNEHRRFEKHTFWEQSVRAPLIIKGKGVLPAAQVSDALVEFVDLVPTVVEALGQEQHPDFQGKSLYSLLKGDTSEHRAEVFSEFLQDDKAMLADQDWKYIFTTGKYDLDISYETGYGPSGIYQRLYHLGEDPEETTNLAYDPAYAEKLEQMQDRMLQRFLDTHPEAEQLPDELNKIGQLVWFCQPRDVGAHYDEKPVRYFFPADPAFPVQQP